MLRACPRLTEKEKPVSSELVPEVPMSPRAAVPAVETLVEVETDAPAVVEPGARWEVGLIPWEYPPGQDGMVLNGWEPLQVIDIDGVQHLVVRRRLASPE